MDTEQASSVIYLLCIIGIIELAQLFVMIF